MKKPLLKSALLLLTIVFSNQALSQIQILSKSASGAQSSTNLNLKIQATIENTTVFGVWVAAASGWKLTCEISSNVIQSQFKNGGDSPFHYLWSDAIAIPGYSSWSGGAKGCYFDGRISASHFANPTYEGSGLTYGIQGANRHPVTDDIPISKHIPHACAPACGGTTGIICP